MELPQRTQPPTLWAQAPMWLRRVELPQRARPAAWLWVGLPVWRVERLLRTRPAVLPPNSLWVPPPAA
jgi:hypothetical protein